jgi:hypothetical protein
MSADDSNERLAPVYNLAAQLVSQFTIDSCHDRIQRADAVTPTDRQEVDRQLQHLVWSPSAPQEGFNLELANFESQFADHAVAEGTDDHHHHDEAEDPPPESTAEKDLNDDQFPVRVQQLLKWSSSQFHLLRYQVIISRTAPARDSSEF